MSLDCSDAKMQPILRLNYGIVFDPIAQVHFGQDVWSHTFQIKLPFKQAYTVIPKCQLMNKCESHNKVIDLIINLQ